MLVRCGTGQSGRHIATHFSRVRYLETPDKRNYLAAVVSAARTIVRHTYSGSNTAKIDYTGAWASGKPAPIIVQWQGLEAKDKAPTQQLVQARFVEDPKPAHEGSERGTKD